MSPRGLSERLWAPAPLRPARPPWGLAGLQVPAAPPSPGPGAAPGTEGPTPRRPGGRPFTSHPRCFHLRVHIRCGPAFPWGQPPAWGLGPPRHGPRAPQPLRFGGPPNPAPLPSPPLRVTLPAPNLGDPQIRRAPGPASLPRDPEVAQPGPLPRPPPPPLPEGIFEEGRAPCALPSRGLGRGINRGGGCPSGSPALHRHARHARPGGCTVSETPTFPQGSGPQHPQPPSPSARPAPPPWFQLSALGGAQGGPRSLLPVWVSSSPPTSDSPSLSVSSQTPPTSVRFISPPAVTSQGASISICLSVHLSVGPALCFPPHRRVSLLHRRLPLSVSPPAPLGPPTPSLSLLGLPQPRRPHPACMSAPPAPPPPPCAPTSAQAPLRPSPRPRWTRWTDWLTEAPPRPHSPTGTHVSLGTFSPSLSLPPPPPASLSLCKSQGEGDICLAPAPHFLSRWGGGGEWGRWSHT